MAESHAKNNSETALIYPLSATLEPQRLRYPSSQTAAHQTSTDHPGCRDAIIKNKTGILIPIKDSEKLSNQIEYLAFNHNLRKSMGAEGRKLAESQFSINLVVEQHMKIYDDILNKL